MKGICLNLGGNQGNKNELYSDLYFLINKKIIRQYLRLDKQFVLNF